MHRKALNELAERLAKSYRRARKELVAEKTHAGKSYLRGYICGLGEALDWVEFCARKEHDASQPDQS